MTLATDTDPDTIQIRDSVAIAKVSRLRRCLGGKSAARTVERLIHTHPEILANEDSIRLAKGTVPAAPALPLPDAGRTPAAVEPAGTPDASAATAAAAAS